MIKVLNLYSGIGGNRSAFSDDCDVTAVEIDPDIADVYSKRFPNDKVIVGDAHAYLIENFDKYDFIWSSPPCPTHGQLRYNLGYKAKGYKPVYPDMRLYEEIILLRHYSDSFYCVENTISFYEPLIKPIKIHRHYIWANFDIPIIRIKAPAFMEMNKISDYEKYYGIQISDTNIKRKLQVLRNCVNPQLAKHIFNSFLFASILS